MKTETEKAIVVLAKDIEEGMDSVDALRFSQAALNLAHVLATLATIKKEEET